MWKKTNNLDELQEQKLLKIESRGFWIAFWGALAVMAVNGILVQEPAAIISSWILFMTLAIYVGGACIRAGIWDRKLDMSNRTCLFLSAVAGVSTGVFGSLFNYLQSGKAAGSLVGGTVLMVITSCLCYAALKLAAKAVRKRQDELNAEPDDTMDFGPDA